MSSADTWTIGRLLTWTTDYLKRQGADSPRLDAEMLLAHVRGCPRIALYTAFDEPADEATRTAFRELVRRRAEGTPVAYLVGRREFYSLSFRVTPDVLIPRPETEFVLIALLDHVKARGGEAAAAGAPVNIADIGTGSGILAICAAKYVPTARVTATDISPAALDVARANAADHGVADRVEWFEGDLLAAIPPDRRFDFIVSNPPYVGGQERGTLADDVRRHEPSVALLAGPRGTEVIERLIPQAVARLRPGGWLILETSPMLATTVAGLLAAAALKVAPTVKDLAGHARVVHGQRG